MYSSTIFPFFADVQLAPIFEDSKIFVDCSPKFPVATIIERYNLCKQQPDFNLFQFIHENFILPEFHKSEYISNLQMSAGEHINELWPYLVREPDATAVSSLIQLPYPYIVPGGRFGEIYYWDSYFTMLGLKACGQIDMIENMVKNFAYLIDSIGYIPNGNRTYYLGRSQPPFFAAMVELLAASKGQKTLQQYLPQIEKEYNFWMATSGNIEPGSALNRVVRMTEGEVLNRYYDDNDLPRPESYKEDIELSKKSTQTAQDLFRNLRAAAESGWDFSSRWFKNCNDFGSIHTTEIIPVDLNCILYYVETVLSNGFLLAANKTKSCLYNSAAAKRKAAIQKYCWDDATGYYYDYDFVQNKQKNIVASSGCYPLFFNLSNSTQAARVIEILRKDLLQIGGVLTTNRASGQQWDAPNGWAPLQWIVIIGLLNYGNTKLAFEIAKKWLALNNIIYLQSGSMMEKYNIVDSLAPAGGGEYPGQDGFGWTNGVYLALSHLLKKA